MANFFEHQDRAQNRTGWLVFLFLFGSVGVLASVTALTAMIMPDAIPAAIIVSVLMIGIPFTFKLLTMSSSGALVAESLGGIRIDPASQETNERKILNIVEEMAIASGMPVPPVYVLDEECINAFAAGSTPQDAVIGVSRGAIDLLTRDELQGVMAHEFSHIFHGDMRINMRAIAAIFGIMAIGYVGYFILRSSLYAPKGRRSDGKSTAAFALFGVGLVVIGCIGTFFGRLMQAAISRQREFLADASAVQYTRNPAGIGGALRKIGSQATATMRHGAASELNHMFFAEGVNALFASHPPILERIQRIEAIAGATLPNSPDEKSLASSVASVGSIPAENLLRAQVGYSACGESLQAAAHDPSGAQAVVLTVTLSQEPTHAIAQRRLITSRMPIIAAEIDRLVDAVQPLTIQQRLAVVDVACATLVRGSTESYKAFRSILSDSVRVDGSINLFEWVVMQILRMRVELPISVRVGKVAAPHKASIASVTLSAQRTLGMIALQGTDDESQAQRWFLSALTLAGLPSAVLPPENERTLDSLAKDLDQLETLRPTAAGTFVHAALACVTADKLTSDREYLLLRALSERLSIPLPTTM